MDVFYDQLNFLPGYLAGHMRLTLLALLAGSAVSVSLGILVSRVAVLQGPVLGVVSVFQTVPSLALLAIMVPLLGMIGFVPALLALTVYSMLPILRNTVVGILGIDDAIIEAAKGMGMTPGQTMRRVQLPLAAPVIIGGIRTATVWVVGTATLSTPIGATSLGNYIFNGLQTRNNPALIIGCISAALLAIVLDGVIRGLEIAVAQRRRKLATTMLVVIAAMFAGAFAGPLINTVRGQGRADVIIGAKPFTEQYILSRLLAAKIERDLHRSTEVRQNLGSTIAFDAVSQGQIDAYVDYSGTIWSNVLKRPTGTVSADEMIDEITRVLRRDYQIDVLGALGFENAYCLAMRRNHADRLGVSKISQLRAVAPQLTLGTDMAFLGRQEFTDLTEKQGIHFASETTMDPVLMYEAVANQRVDIISAFSTDGRIAAYDLLILDDDIAALPPYDAIILLSATAADRLPTLKPCLEAIVGTIDDESMMRANWRVDQKGNSVATVARDLLIQIDHRESTNSSEP